MARKFRVGDCVRIPDGRCGRVREVSAGKYRVRVRRTTSVTHQFLVFAAGDLKRVDCPKGWMSPEGYVRYLKVTLAKTRQRQARLGESTLDIPDRIHSPSQIVLTVGHSNRPLEAFLRLLQTHGATLVVDVRKMPGSRRNPQFGRDTLPQALRQAGIGYSHMPGLGGLRRRRPDSPNTGWENASFQGYADYMLTPAFEQSLQELLERADGERTVLMCAEAVPWRCHRSLIADALVVRGVAVEHILGASRTQPHVLRPWARVQGMRITYPPPVEDNRQGTPSK